jgi:hypothetical protein
LGQAQTHKEEAKTKSIIKAPHKAGNSLLAFFMRSTIRGRGRRTGAGGIVSLSDPITPGEYTAYMEHATDGQSLLTIDPNLVGFAMDSVPEPQR